MASFAKTGRAVPSSVWLAGLSKAQMMGVGWGSPADHTRLSGHKIEALL